MRRCDGLFTANIEGEENRMNKPNAKPGCSKRKMRKWKRITITLKPCQKELIMTLPLAITKICFKKSTGVGMTTNMGMRNES